MKKLFLKSKKINFILILGSLFFSSVLSAAVIKPFGLGLPTTRASRTEASVCNDCLNSSRKPSNLSNYLSQLPIVKNGEAKVFNAAYFDDGNDKQAVVDLRARKARGEKLTAKEEALLQAAARTGQITFCNGLASNAFLVKINDKDAIITTAHAVINPETGKPRCDLSKTGYYPNLSFYDATDGDSNPTDFEKRKVMTDGRDPLNLENVLGTKGKIDSKKDFLIFFLEEQVSNDRLPDSTSRGALSFSNSSSKTGSLNLIGTDPNFREGRATTYQECKYEISGNLPYHTCDTLEGVSSSLLSTYENGEFKFFGIHTSGLDKTGLDTSDNLSWNGGLKAKEIANYLSSEDLIN